MPYFIFFTVLVYIYVYYFILYFSFNENFLLIFFFFSFLYFVYQYVYALVLSSLDSLSFDMYIHFKKLIQEYRLAIQNVRFELNNFLNTIMSLRATFMNFLDYQLRYVLTAEAMHTFFYENIFYTHLTQFLEFQLTFARSTELELSESAKIAFFNSVLNSNALRSAGSTDYNT